MNKKELWKPIPGLSFYEASTLGRIRSMKVGKGARRPASSKPGHVMSGCPDEKGYLLVNCRIDGANKSQRVHRLVARTFLGEIPAGHQINHLNGNKADNRIENLEICTPSANQRHRNHVLKVQMNWYRSPGARKLNDQKVREIREKVASGRLFTDVAKDYGVSANCISNIWHRRRWAHVT